MAQLLKLYHFTDEKGVAGIKSRGFAGPEGRSSFYFTVPPDDLAPMGSTDCTWVVIIDIPGDAVDPDPNYPAICTVSDELLQEYRSGFQYERVDPELRSRWRLR
jgi:hypothetical protein